MNGYTEITGIDWLPHRMLPAFQPPEHLGIYDIRNASHDVQLSVTTLAGLINCPQPQVYLITQDDDIFWLKQSFSSIPQTASNVTNDNMLTTLLSTYNTVIRGLIIYDPDFIDSINIATMLAGQLNGLVVSPAQADAFQQSPYQLPILTDLRTHKWSTRLQAYSWAKDNLLNASSSYLVAGLDPKFTTGLRSFLVATRTFIYWLDSRHVIPHPTHRLPSEHRLMKDILQTFSSRAVHLGWFLDEPSGVNLTSHAAIPVLASDLFINLEVWTSIQPEKVFSPQLQEAQEVITTIDVSDVGADFSRPAPIDRPTASNNTNQTTAETANIYVSFTMSDGDNLQYIQHRMSRIWQDPARGSLPIGWTISSVLMQAAPAMAAYYASTATSNDELIAGPSGAGYMFPSAWPQRDLPAFLQRTGQLMRDMHLTILEVLDTDRLHNAGLPLPAQVGSSMVLSNTSLQRQFAEELLPYGIRGILSGAGRSTSSWTSYAGVPIYQNLGLADSITRTLELIRNAASANKSRPLYLNVYLLAWKITPSDLKQVAQQLGSEYKVVTPGILLAMLTPSNLMNFRDQISKDEDRT